MRTSGSIQFIRSIQSTESIASINTKTIHTINQIGWHCRPHQPNCTTVVSFLCFPSWLRQWVLLCYIQCCLFLRSHLTNILLLFNTQCCSVTHSRGDTAIPTRNGLLFYISCKTIYSNISHPDITLLLCSRRYQLQQGGYYNHVKPGSRWWSSNKWFYNFDLVVC